MEQNIHPVSADSGRQTGAQNNTAARGQNASARNNGANTAATTRTVGNTQPANGVARAATSLRVGDVLRGEITDLKNGQIALTLEDNTILRGRISDGSSYSIGQVAYFRLKDIAGQTIFLEHVQTKYTETEKTLINKALAQANLPATDHNQATVKALMDNLLPINRNSIQGLMQQAYDLDTGDMNTLALMNRLFIKTDADSVKQFSSYREGDYALLPRLQEFAENVPALLHALADNGTADAVADFGKNLLSVGLAYGDTAGETFSGTLADLPADIQADIIRMLADTPLTEQEIEALNDRTLSLADTAAMLGDAARNGTFVLPEGADAAGIADQLNQIAASADPSQPQETITADNLLEFSDSKAPEKEEENTEIPEAKTDNENAAKEDDSAFTRAGKFLRSVSANARSTLSDTLETLRNTGEQNLGQTAGQTTNQNAALTKLNEVIAQNARNFDNLSFFLDSGQRQELCDGLKNFPLSKTLLDDIRTGQADAREVLSAIQQTINLTDAEFVKKLFQTTSFEKLFARELLSAWTASPEQIKNGNLSEVLERTQAQMQQFQQLIGDTLSGSDSGQLKQFAHDIEKNIEMLKTLNENFSFAQLPLKLQNQDTNCDLYVYTQNEKQNRDKPKTSVFLHLDLTHLGTVDIRLEKDRQSVTAKFFLEDADAVNLFSVNADMLSDSLNELGYNCQTQFQEKKDPSPTVDDFINTKVNTRETDSMKRFSFDIRA